MVAAPASGLAWRAARRCAGWALLGALLATGVPATAASAAETAVPAVVDPALAAALARLQYDSRVRPDGIGSQWAGLLPRLVAHPALHIEALFSAGAAQAVVADDAGVDRTVEQLRVLAEGASPRVAAWARVAADAVRAQRLRRQGPVGRADRLLSDAVAGLPADVPAPLRLHFVNTLAGLKEQGGKFDDAVRLYQEAIALGKALAVPPWQQVDLVRSLAYTLFRAGQHDRALQVQAQAMALARAAQDDLALSTVHTTESILLTDSDTAASEAAARAALSHAQRAGAERDEVLATANLADLYLRRGDYKQALVHAEHALPLARRLKYIDAQTVALANIGLAQIMLGRKDEGLRNARASVALDEQTGSLDSLVLTHAEVGQYLERAGYLVEAYAERREQRRLAEQLFRRDQQQAVIELQEGFDHEQRQSALALLDGESRIQQAQLVSQQLQQWLWATGAAIGLALAVLGTLLLRRVRAGNAQLARANAQLSELSERDVLTGLANRRHFQSALRARGSEAAVAGTLMLIDIDHFKHINDRYGHAAGDGVLVEVARRLRAALRDDDLIVRWGGEEFLVLVKSTQRGEVDALVQRLLLAVASQPVLRGALPVPVSASIGFASFPLEPTLLALRVEQAVDLVDTVMYLAKAHGRHRAYGLRRAEAADAPSLLVLARDLEAAWRDGRVELTAIVGPAPGPLAEVPR